MPEEVAVSGVGGSLASSLGTGKEDLKIRATLSSGHQSRSNFCINRAKMEWGLSPKAKVRVLHTAQLDVTNLEDSSDPINAMNKALALMAKAFKINTIPTNNNQRSSVIPRNSQIAQPDMNTSQDIKMQMVDDNVGNHVRNNAVQNDGNEVWQNAVQNSGIQIVENMNGLSVVPEIANQYGNRNVVTAPTEGKYNDINGNPIRCYNSQGEGYYANNCIVKPRKQDAAYLQQQLQIALEEEAGIQSTQEEFEFMAAVDAYEETKRVKVKCTLEDTLQQASIFGTQSDNAPVYDTDGSTEVERLQAQLGDLKGKSSDNQCASNTIDPVTQKPKDENMSLESQVLNYAKENAHLKTTYENLTNPSKTFRVDNVIPNKPMKTSVRIKPITVSQPNIIHKQQANSDSNGFSSTRVHNIVKTRRPHPKSNSNTDRVPSKSKSSCLSNNVKKIEENHRNSQIPNNQKHMSSECNNITLAIRNAKSKNVCVKCKQCLVTANHNVCVLNYVNNINSRADNQSANVSICENQTKHKANTKKSKELGSKESLTSSRTSKPRTCLRWIPTGRIFSMCEKLTASSNTENKSKKSVCDNASTSNPSKPSRKGFSNSAFLLGILSRLRKQHTSIHPIDVL
uniref:Gag-Pol polyprotein n=1 Tax=Tanacetum cinerariifolium TaxID=118510 RepID=A0A6L2NZ11_TANCI|nr:hypothetical protein [Tanacetum cinerariifolium]